MRKKVTFILITFILFYLLLSPRQTALDTARGLALWYDQVVPTLLPFCILSYIIIQTDLYHSVFQKLMHIFPFRSQSSAERLYPICLGFVCGFPIGSKLTADLYEAGHLPDASVTRLCAVSNQFGPAFLVNYIAITQLESAKDSLVLLLSIYLPPLLLGWCWYKIRNNPRESIQHKIPAPRSSLDAKIIDTGIINGFETMLRIAGYIVIFSIISGIINQIPIRVSALKAVFAGICEITTGVEKIAATSLPHQTKLILICAVVSFGGLCGMSQTKAMMRRAPFGLSKYMIFKSLCAVLSTVFVCILYQLLF